jgi:hypothetical protein
MSDIPLNLVREIHFLIDGETRTGKLSIHRITFSQTGQKWECHWSLDHLYPETVSFTGDDPLQALTRTLDFASSFIRGRELDGCKVHWQYEEDHAGLVFPMCEERSWTKD